MCNTHDITCYTNGVAQAPLQTPLDVHNTLQYPSTILTPFNMDAEEPMAEQSTAEISDSSNVDPIKELLANTEELVTLNLWTTSN